MISFTDPYMVVGMVFFVLANRDDIESVDDLNTAEMKVGFGRGSTQEILVPAAAPDVTIVRFAGMADTLEALNSRAHRRNRAGQYRQVRNTGGQSGQVQSPPGALLARRHLSWIAEGRPRMVGLLDTWMRDFNLSGKNDALYAKWFGAERPSVFGGLVSNSTGVGRVRPARPHLVLIASKSKAM